MPELWFPLKGDQLQRSRPQQEAFKNYELHDQSDQIVFATPLPGRPTVPTLPTHPEQVTSGNQGIVLEKIFYVLVPANINVKSVLVHEFSTDLVDVMVTRINNTAEPEGLQPVAFKILDEERVEVESGVNGSEHIFAYVVRA